MAGPNPDDYKVEKMSDPFPYHEKMVGKIDKVVLYRTSQPLRICFMQGSSFYVFKFVTTDKYKDWSYDWRAGIHGDDFLEHPIDMFPWEVVDLDNDNLDELIIRRTVGLFIYKQRLEGTVRGIELAARDMRFHQSVLKSTDFMRMLIGKFDPKELSSIQLMAVTKSEMFMFKLPTVLSGEVEELQLLKLNYGSPFNTTNDYTSVQLHNPRISDEQNNFKHKIALYHQEGLSVGSINSDASAMDWPSTDAEIKNANEGGLFLKSYGEFAKDFVAFKRSAVVDWYTWQSQHDRWSIPDLKTGSAKSIEIKPQTEDFIFRNNLVKYSRSLDIDGDGKEELILYRSVGTHLTIEAYSLVKSSEFKEVQRFTQDVSLSTGLRLGPPVGFLPAIPGSIEYASLFLQVNNSIQWALLTKSNQELITTVTKPKTDESGNPVTQRKTTPVRTAATGPIGTTSSAMSITPFWSHRCDSHLNHFISSLPQWLPQLPHQLSHQQESRDVCHETPPFILALLALFLLVRRLWR